MTARPTVAVFMRFIFVDGGAAAEMVRPSSTTHDFAYYYYHAGIAWRLQEEGRGQKEKGGSRVYLLHRGNNNVERESTWHCGRVTIGPYALALWVFHYA